MFYFVFKQIQNLYIQRMNNDENPYNLLSVEKQLELLKKELEKVKHEINISKLIYSNHGCDSYEDLFRDNVPRLIEKMEGIQIAIDTFNNLSEGGILTDYEDDNINIEKKQ